MRRRKKILSKKEELEIIDLFEKSPMSVTAIAKAYEVNRLTVYHVMHRWEDGSAVNSENSHGHII